MYPKIRVKLEKLSSWKTTPGLYSFLSDATRRHAPQGIFEPRRYPVKKSCYIVLIVKCELR